MRPQRVSRHTNLALVREWDSLPTFGSSSDGSGSAAADVQPQVSASHPLTVCSIYGNACCTKMQSISWGCCIASRSLGMHCESGTLTCRCQGLMTPQQLPVVRSHHVQVTYVSNLLNLLCPQPCGLGMLHVQRSNVMSNE